MIDETTTPDLPRMRANRILARARAHVEVLRFIAAHGVPALSPRKLHERVEEFAGCHVPAEAVAAMVRVVGGAQ